MNYNCLSYWYPRIEGHVPTPETHILALGDDWPELNRVCEGEIPPPFHVVKDFYVSAGKTLGYPMFMRTGQGSGKHQWERCCYLQSANDIGSHIAGLVEWSLMVDMIGLPVNVWVARKMLSVLPSFRCRAYCNMPVVREWRVFVDRNEAIKSLPYWPIDALEQGMPDNPDWRRRLPYLLGSCPHEGIKMAEIVGKLLPEQKWSVDILEACDGLYVTDMALAEQSWGWE